MKRLSSFLFCVCACTMLVSRLAAQSPLVAEALKHPVILKYYTPDQLQSLGESDSTKLKSIVYYFTQSFIVIPEQCDECLPFDPQNFDILAYEHLRLPDQTYICSFGKYGFKLVLLPVNELPYRYPVHQVAPPATTETGKH